MTLPVLLGAGAGFLLAVLWFDLMFDVQALHLDHADGEASLTSIADYYRRVTIQAFPANQLVATVMIATIVGSVVQVFRGPLATGRALLALLLITAPVALAGWRVVPNAMRLGRREDPLPVQRTLARTIFRDHVLCFTAILAFLLLQIL